MKSYLRFLSRNKLYTAIEVVGLSVALAFLIILGSYLLDDIKCDRSIVNSDEVHVVRNRTIMNEFYVRSQLTEDVFNDIPGIRSHCQVYYKEMDFSGNRFTAEHEGVTQYFNSLLAVDSNFFRFFSFPFSGSGNNVLTGSSGVVISKSLAEKLFGKDDPTGEIISIPFTYFSEKQELVITGIFDEFPNISLPYADVIINIDTYRSLGERYVYPSDHSTLFLRIDPKSDKDQIQTGLNDSFRLLEGRQGTYDIELVSLKDFHRKEGHGARAEGRFRNTDVFDLYMLLSIMLAVLSLLNYILLTIAYSHVRIKEMATRQMLGTDKVGITLRCILEALCLILTSMVTAAILAVTFSGAFSRLLDIEINPMTSIGEYLIPLGAALLMAVPAGLASAAAFAKHNPVEVLKGQNRRQEKMILSKLFIGLEGCLAIISTSVLISVTAQNMFMINYPMGYETENLVHMEFKTNGARHQDIIRSMPFVEEFGLVSSIPMYRYHVMFPQSGNHIGIVEGERKVFDMLGITLSDYGKTPDINQGSLYLSEATMEALRESVEDKEWLKIDSPGIRREIMGTCTHFRTGTLKQPDNNLCGAVVIQDWIAEKHNEQYNLLVKVSGNEIEACRNIREAYKGRGYDEDLISVVPLKQFLHDDIKKERSLQNLLLVFVLTSLFLTAMAIGAFSGYYARLKMQDSAVRKVFGESRLKVFMRSVWGFILPVLISATVAIPVAYLMVSEWLESYIWRINNSWTIYASALLFVTLTVAISVVLQAARLMRTNPAEVLKKE